jgi:hypothetical protein
MKLKLPIYFFTEELIPGSKVVLDEECQELDITFYTIDGILPYLNEDGSIFTMIYSCATQFVCPLSPKEVEHLIDRASINILN